MSIQNIMSNFYEVLGISNDATDEQIKKAYRKLSLQYHPDRNTDPSASAKFQEINEAHETLSDPAKRAGYDNAGNPMQGGIQFHDINDIFNSFFGGGGAGGPDIRFFHHGMPQQGNHPFFQNLAKPMPIVKNIKLTLEQCYFGGSIPIEVENGIW